MSNFSSPCDSANQDIWQNDHQEEVDKFLIDLARQLSECALPFPKTGDFVTYAINLDNGTYVEDASPQFPSRIASLLRQRGLL